MKLTPRVIWGKLVAILRQRREMSLLIACGDIVDVNIVNNTFEVNVDDKTIIEIITKEENLAILNNILKDLGYDYTIKINKKDKPADLFNKDIEYLTKLVGNKLKIKE